MSDGQLAMTRDNWMVDSTVELTEQSLDSSRVTVDYSLVATRGMSKDK